MKKDYKKLMVIGSGPIVIGQAAEFDFSGSQACKSVREEGYNTVLVNSNPATIQTDVDMADSVYIEPLEADVIEKIIVKEGVDGILAGMGGKTYKMKFGHRGENQPVKFEGRVYITSQNHGFAVDEKSLEGTGLIVNQVNVNDGTVEGVMHKDLPIFTCQYHPEASPGPMDTTFLFDRFKKTIEEARM